MGSSPIPVPIAIIGTGCRLPGGVTNSDKLWELLVAKQNVWTGTPPGRYNDAAFIHRSENFQGGHNHEGGHFLEGNIAAFDADFFGINPEEANAMDPQQRLLLEVTYEAFENGGVPAKAFRGSDTAVYVASFTHDYDRNIFKDPLNIPKYHVTGCGDAILANRLSYVFDLKGPSITLNTGCSGGLVALHHACQSLQLGESGMAIAAGANLILGPDHMISMSNLHMLNDQGRSFSFDARGSGYGRGEGVVSIVLKTLDRALRDGDNVRAIIRGTGVNQDGKTKGITRPNPDAQQALIERVHRQTRIKPEDLAYLEAHGTGTKAGDNLECEAIANAICSKRTKNLRVGSIKSNIGHLEASSGLAGLLKAMLILKNKQIVPNAAFRNPKKSLALESKKIEIPQTTEGFSIDDTPVVSVSSFGYGGTNAYAILGDEQKAHELIADGPTGAQLFLLSAHSKKATKESARQLSRWLQHQPGDLDMQSVAYTLAQRRSFMPWRMSLVAQSRAELLEALDIHKSPVAIDPDPQVMFVFSGQGSQWARMGAELLDNINFQQSILDSQATLHRLGAKWDLVAELEKPEQQSTIHRPLLAQPVNVAFQIALVDLLTGLGVQPQAVVGHSSGEIAASYAAGILSKAEALSVSYHRGLAADRLKDIHKGAMLAVGLSEDEAVSQLKNLGLQNIGIACVNSPMSTTLSGSKKEIEQLQNHLECLSIFNRSLSVDLAYHSKYMSLVADQYRDSLEDSMGTQSSAKFFSSVTGNEKDTGFGPEYWTRNMVSKVRFQEALEACVSTRLDSAPNTEEANLVFVEIGPHETLSSVIRQCLAKMGISRFTYASTISRTTDPFRSVGALAGTLFELGWDVNSQIVQKLHTRSANHMKLLDLPSYSWDHSKSFWYEPRLSSLYRTRNRPFNDLLGIRIADSTSFEPRWRYVIGLDSHPWLAEHLISNSMVYPGAGYLCMVIEAAKEIIEDECSDSSTLQIVLKNVSFIEALFVPQLPHRSELQLSFHILRQNSNKERTISYSFRIVALTEDEKWVEHCCGYVDIIPRPSTTKSGIDTRPLTSPHAQTLQPVSLYEELKEQGNTYGEHFKNISAFSILRDQAQATIRVPNVPSDMSAKYQQEHTFHPATLDSVLHSSLPLYSQTHERTALMPVHIQKLIVTHDTTPKSGQQLFVRTQAQSCEDNFAIIHLSAYRDETLSDLVLAIDGLELRAVSANQTSNNTKRDICHQLQWDIDVDFMDETSFEMLDSSNDDDMKAKQRTAVLNQAASNLLSNYLDKQTEDVPNSDQRISKLHHWMEQCRDAAAVQSSQGPEIENSNEQQKLNGTERKLLTHIENQLPSITDSEPSAWMSSPGGDLFYQHLEETEHLGRIYQHLSRYCQQYFFKRPKMNVLELGARSSTVAKVLFEALDHSTELPVAYDYTDTSTESFGTVKNASESWIKFMQFRTLNISQDLETQGYKEHSYDLIIAANAFLTTGDLATSLKNAYKLLKPHGKLLVIEITKPQPYLNVICASFSPRFHDPQGHCQAIPFLTEEQWRLTLAEQSLKLNTAVREVDDLGNEMALFVCAPLIADETQPLRFELLGTEGQPMTLSSFSETLSAALNRTKHSVFPISWTSDFHNPETVYIVLDGCETPLLADSDPLMFKHITRLLRNGRHVLWLSFQENIAIGEDPSRFLINGLARIAQAENSHLHMITVCIQQDTAEYQEKLLRVIATILETSFGSTPHQSAIKEREYIYRKGNLLIPRLVPDMELNHRVSKNSIEIRTQSEAYRNNADILELSQDLTRVGPKTIFQVRKGEESILQENELIVEVAVWAIYQSDGKYLGSEKGSTKLRACAGFVRECHSRTPFHKGQRVVALSPSLFSSCIKAPFVAAHPISESTSFPTAASNLLTFLTAYHVLVRIIRLAKDQSILIYNGASHQGQALIAMALYLGSKVFAQVSTETERLLLLKNLSLDEEKAFLDSSNAMAEGAFCQSNGERVDILVECANYDGRRADTSCIAPLGRYMIISTEASNIDNPLALLKQSVTVSSFDPDGLRSLEPSVLQPMLSAVMNMLENGMSTLDHAVDTISISEVRNAFETPKVQNLSRQIVALAHEEDIVKVSRTASSMYSLHGNASYLVCGGLGDVGQSVCQLMALRGAKQIIVFSRRASGSEAEKALSSRIKAIAQDATLHVLRCDISNAEEVREAAAQVSRLGLPPVKGIVQATVVLQDQLLDELSFEQFRIPLEAKKNGTLYLQEVFAGSPLDFFLLLPSVASIVGSGGQAGYGAANAFQDHFAISNSNTRANYLALDLGMVSESKAITPHRQQLLKKQGLVLIEPDELQRLLDYAMSSDAINHQSRQIVMGLDADSVALARQHTANGNVHSPMFCHILPDSADALNKSQQSQCFKDQTATLRSLREAEGLILRMISQHLSMVVAQDPAQIGPKSRLTELGMDSLNALEVRNWVKREFQAAFRTSELLDQVNIESFVHKIALRSTLVREALGQQIPASAPVNTRMETSSTKMSRKSKSNEDLPRLPLPDLSSTLDMYLNSRQVFMSKTEYKATSNLIRKFREDGTGAKLQGRLNALQSDTKIENWISDIYADCVYLGRRDPIYPYGIFIAGHPLTEYQHSQAERAAVIARATIELQTQIENGTLEPDQLNGDQVCMESSNWLFNVCREPHKGVDHMHKYSNTNYFAVLRRGHIFKVSMPKQNSENSLKELMTAFEYVISQSTENVPSLTTLTSDSRDSWAQIRHALVSKGGDNHKAIQMVEAAAFVICLDDGSPSTPSERCNQFFLGSPTNRWADKSVQYVVCENGVSAFIGEHARIDGMGARHLVRHVAEAITRHEPTQVTTSLNGSANGSIMYRPKRLPSIESEYVTKFPTSIEPLLTANISTIQTRFAETFQSIEFRHYYISIFGSTFLRSHKCPPKTGYQLVVQLACRLWYSHFPDIWETVSLARFHKGRIDWLQTVSEESANFCEEALSLSPEFGKENLIPNGHSVEEKRDRQASAKAHLRKLFQKASSTHANSITRIASGHGFKAHMHALRAVVNDGKSPLHNGIPKGSDESDDKGEIEPVPELFLDKQWQATEVPAIKKVKVDCLEGMPMSETAFLMPRSDCIFIHYEVEENGCKFFVQTWPGLADSLCEKLELAAEVVKRVLEE